MSVARPVLHSRLGLWLSLLVSLLALSAGEVRDFGRVQAQLPDPTREGSFYGTWYYGNRDQNMALWIRPGEQGPELRMRMMNMNSAEGFETDWSGRSEYVHQGWPGIFSLEITDRSDDEIRGSWLWVLDRGSVKREERGRVTLFRHADGRFLVLKFEDYQKSWQSTAEEEKALSLPLDFFWSFRKGSNRLVEWEELPF